MMMMMMMILTNSSFYSHSSSLTTSMHSFKNMHCRHGECCDGRLCRAGLEDNAWLTPSATTHWNQSYHFTLPALVHLPTFPLKLPSDLAEEDMQLLCGRSTTEAKNKDCYISVDTANPIRAEKLKEITASLNRSRKTLIRQTKSVTQFKTLLKNQNNLKPLIT